SVMDRCNWDSPLRLSNALSLPMRRLSPPASTRPYVASPRCILVILLAARLRDEARFANRYLVRQCLAHVVDGQRGHAGAGQRLHLHPGTVVYLANAVDDGPVPAVHVDGDAAVVESERMAERD